MPQTKAHWKTMALAEDLKKKAKEKIGFVRCLSAITNLGHTYSEEQISSAEEALRQMFPKGEDSERAKALIAHAADFRHKKAEYQRQKQHQKAKPS